MSIDKLKATLKLLFQKEHQQLKNQLHKEYLLSGNQNSILKEKVMKIENLKNELDLFLSRAETKQGQ